MNKIINFATIEKVIVALMCIFIYIFNYQTTGFGNTVTNIIIIDFIAMEMLFVIKKNNLVKNHEIISLFIFLAICLFSCIYSFNSSDSLVKVKTLCILLLMLIGLMCFFKKDKNNIDFFLKSISISGVLSSIYLIFLFDWKSGVRIDNVLGDSNQVATYIAYSFIVLLYLLKSKKTKKIYSILGLVLMFIANILSGSRSALIVTFLGGIIYVFMSMKPNKTKIFKTIFIFIIALIVLYFLYYFMMNNETLYNIIGKRYISFFEIINGGSSSINETSTQTRSHLIDLAWGKFTENFWTILFGNGIGFFASYWTTVGGRYAFCHNNYLELLSGVGIIGTICFYYTYIKTLLVQLKDYKKNHSQTSVLCVSLLIQIYLMHWFVVFYYQKCEILFLVILIYFNYLVKKEKEKINNEN